MSKRGTDGVDAGSSAKKSKSASGPVAPAASVSGAQHSGAKKHSHHGPLPLVATGEVKYLPGFGGEHQNRDSCPYGLFAEQLSGTSFTTPRKDNQRSWFYRIRPTVGHPPFQAASDGVASKLVVGDFSSQTITPNQFRWRPFSMEQVTGVSPAASSAPRVDFVQGLATVAGAGAPDTKTGMAIHVYTCNTSMVDKGFVNSDGDFLIVPQQGTLHLRTEFGMLRVAPGHIAVVQRGIVFSVGVEESADGTPSRGYICEVFNGHFKLPELGPIGANGLAAPRDFLHPTAEFEDRQCEFLVVQKFIGKFFQYTRTHSPYDVVAWHGNYAPYMYDLSKFCPVGAVQFDHLDPSVFTVLTCATTEPGVACADFVVFPPRWAVQEHTFRPPYYHRNIMSEFMGNIMGKYEAKPDGFLPGGASLHSCMAAHGPDAATFAKASTEEQRPVRLPSDALAFMFESTYLFRLTDWALRVAAPDADYWRVWEPIQGQFDPDWKPTEQATKAQ